MSLSFSQAWALREVTAPPPPAGTTFPVSEYLVSPRVQILPASENTRLS